MSIRDTRKANRALLTVMSLMLTLTFAPETGARAQAENMAPTGHVNQFERLGDFEPRYNQHDTLYSAQVTDPEGGPLTYTWTATIECGTFFPNAPAAHEAVWSHNHDPAPQGCGSHDRPENDSFHDGVVELTVRDDAGNQLKCTINGSVGGGSLPCGPPPEECTLDMRLYDGQRGSRPSDAAEETRGAFTVANGNDTDGNGVADTKQRMVPGEKDLMRVRLLPPQPDQGGVVTFVPEDAGLRVEIYKSPTKGPRVERETRAPLRIPTRRLPMTLWLEGRHPSAGLRDVQLRYAYKPPDGPTCRDTATVTIVGALDGGVRHDAGQRIWATMPQRPRDALERLCGGFGLRPVGAAPGGVRNCIGFQFKMLPPGIGSEPGVEFDVARQRSSSFVVEAVSDSRELQRDRSRFPDGDEPNDDAHDNDESRRPDPDDRLYSFAGPGTPNPRIEPPERVRAFYDARFREYVRVRFDGVRPTGNQVSGSVVSSTITWAARHTWVSNARGVLSRTTGDERESDENFVVERL